MRSLGFKRTKPPHVETLLWLGGYAVAALGAVWAYRRTWGRA